MEEHENKVKSIYQGIKQRCGNKNSQSYHRYGGRGIKCLITFRELIEAFRRDGASKLKKPSVDRIDNDGDYVAHNIRWIELQENISRSALKNPRGALYDENGFVALAQPQRDSRRDTTLVRLGIDLVNLMKKDARKQKKTTREVMESILRERFCKPETKP